MMTILGFSHPAFASPYVALLDASLYVPRANHFHVARLGGPIGDRSANGQIAHGDGSVLGCLWLDASRRHPEAFQCRFAPWPDEGDDVAVGLQLRSSIARKSQNFGFRQILHI